MRLASSPRSPRSPRPELRRRQDSDEDDVDYMGWPSAQDRATGGYAEEKDGYY